MLSEKGAPIQHAGMLPSRHGHGAINHHIINAGGVFFRFVKGGVVDDRLRIKDDEVSRQTFSYQPPVIQAKTPCRRRLLSPVRLPVL